MCAPRPRYSIEFGKLLLLSTLYIDTSPATPSNAKALWVNPPMMDEEMLLQQCAALKALNPSLRCFVYRWVWLPFGIRGEESSSHHCDSLLAPTLAPETW